MIGIHGPMQELIMDCESGTARSNLFQTEMSARGIKFTPRAPQQHARHIERRGAILRHSLHTIEAQLIREGIKIAFPSLLAEAVFAGNSLTHVGGVTPYHVVYGRQPQMLPPIPIGDEEPQEGGGENLSRDVARVREVALQAMIEATAQARINRAMRTSTALPIEQRLEVGEEVEFHRPNLNPPR